MSEIIIDATNNIAGRLSTFVAKQALMGNSVNILNSEKVVVSGDVRRTINESKHKKFVRGVPRKGPFYSKFADRFLRRIIRGMLPYKQPRGVEAYKKIMCYIGVPSEFDITKAIKIKEADASKLPDLKFVSLGQLCKEFGAD